MVNLNDRTLVNKLTRTAHAVAKGYGMLDHVDDFKQFMFEKYLGGRKTKVALLFVDYIRQEFGDSRHESTTFKFNNAVEWEDSMDSEVVEQYDFDFDNMINKFEGVDRSILILFYRWGFTNKEISDVLGVTEGRITQRTQEIERKLRKRFGNA